MNPFPLHIATKTGEIFDGEALSVTLPTASGQITILAHHTPLISVIAPGEMKVVTADGEQRFETSHGLLDIRPAKTVVLLHGSESSN